MSNRMASFGALHSKAANISPKMREYTLELERILRQSLASTGGSTTVVAGSSGGSVSPSSNSCAQYLCTWNLNGIATLYDSNAYVEIIFGPSGNIIFSDGDARLLEIG